MQQRTCCPENPQICSPFATSSNAHFHCCLHTYCSCSFATQPASPTGTPLNSLTIAAYVSPATVTVKWHAQAALPLHNLNLPSLAASLPCKHICLEWNYHGSNTYQPGTWLQTRFATVTIVQMLLLGCAQPGWMLLDICI